MKPQMEDGSSATFLQKVSMDSGAMTPLSAKTYALSEAPFTNVACRAS